MALLDAPMIPTVVASDNTDYGALQVSLQWKGHEVARSAPFGAAGTTPATANEQQVADALTAMFDPINYRGM